MEIKKLNEITITKRDFDDAKTAFEIEKTYGNKSARKWLTACVLTARALNKKLPKELSAVTYSTFASQYRKILKDCDFYKKELNRTGHVLVINKSGEIKFAIDVRTFDSSRYQFGTVSKDGLLNKAIDDNRWTVHFSDDFNTVKFARMGILKNDTTSMDFYRSSIFRLSEEDVLVVKIKDPSSQQQDVVQPFAEQCQ